MTKRKTETVNDLRRCLVPLDMDATLIAVIEMSQSIWLVAGIVPGVERQPLKKIAIDEDALLEAVEQLAEGGREERTQDHTRYHRVRGRTRRFLAGAPARRIRHRGPRHSCIECPCHTRPPPGEDRSARHGASEAWLSRLAARRTRALQNGPGADTCRGGRQAPEPGAGGARW